MPRLCETDDRCLPLHGILAAKLASSWSMPWPPSAPPSAVKSGFGGAGDAENDEDDEDGWARRLFRNDPRDKPDAEG